MENRLTLTEDRMSTIIAHTRGLGEIPVTLPSHAKTSMYAECEKMPDMYLRTTVGPPSGNMNVTAISGLTQGQSMFQNQSQLFDDRSYDDLSKSNIRTQQQFQNMSLKTNDWMRPSTLQELQANDEYMRESKRYSDETGSDYGEEGKKGRIDCREEGEEEEDEDIDEDEDEEPIEVGRYDIIDEEYDDNVNENEDGGIDTEAYVLQREKEEEDEVEDEEMGCRRNELM